MQSEIRESLAYAFDEEDSRLRQCAVTETNRDREETREVVVVSVPKSSPMFSRWPSIKAIGAIRRSRKIDGKVEEWQDCFIGNLSPTVRTLRDILRSLWSIENSQHHILDVTFTEDSSRIRKGNGPDITSAFGSLALTILQQGTSIKGSIRGKRKVCGWGESAFQRLLAGISEV